MSPLFIGHMKVLAVDQPTEKLQFVAYMRVSTGQQKVDNTIENQRRAIEGYLSYHDNIEIIKWYEDNGKSAFKDRPKYDEMMRDIDRWNGIIISKLSRIGRRTAQLLDIVKMLNDKNKQLVVVSDSIDTTSAQGTFFFTILAAFNEYEANLIRERMSEGRKRYLDDGGKLGRRRRTFDDNNRIPPKNKEILDLYNAGYGIARLAKLYLVSRSTIRAKLLELGITLRKPRGFE